MREGIKGACVRIPRVTQGGLAQKLWSFLSYLLFFIALMMTIPPVMSRDIDEPDWTMHVLVASILFFLSRVACMVSGEMKLFRTLVESFFFAVFVVGLAIRFTM